MNIEMLVDAIGEVNPDFVIRADELAPGKGGTAVRRAGLMILAAALVAALTVVTAMAVSNKVREAVFEFFKAADVADVDNERGHLDDNAARPGEQSPGMSVGSFKVLSGGAMESYRIEGYCDVWQGVVIAHPGKPDEWWINTSYFTPSGGLLREMTEWHEVDVTARGVDVRFRWSEQGGALAVHTPYQDPGVREDFPKYSVVTKENLKDKLIIELYDGGAFPAVYDIRAGKVTEPFAGISREPTEPVFANSISFSSDLHYAIFSEGLLRSESGDELYLADLKSGAVRTVAEVCGMERVNEAWFYGDGTIIGYYLSPDYRFDFRAVDLATGEVTAALRDAPMAHRERYTWGSPEDEYRDALLGRTHEGVGEAEGVINVPGSRAVLWRDSDGGVSVLDLITGERWLVPGLSDAEGDLAPVASPLGDKLFDTVEREGEDALTSLYVLDVEGHRLSVLDRAGTAEYNVVGWLDDDRVYFLTDAHYDWDEDNKTYLHQYMYAYRLD